MKLLVIGLGSMGKRRIKLLTKYYKSEIEVAGVDTREDRRSEVEKAYHIVTYSNLDHAISIEKPDGVLICTSPSSHADITLMCISHKAHIFSEINLLREKHNEIIQAASSHHVHLFLSSTMLYRREIQYIQSEVQASSRKVHYRYHVGQYLPDWHPWESYKDFFVNKKETNGCREILAIELPWIIKTFGDIVDFKVVRDNISSLELDYPDSYLVILEHKHGHKGVLNVDIVSRKAIRSLEIYSEELQLFWEGTPQSFMQYDLNTQQFNLIETYATVDKDNKYAESIIENAYLEELDVFIQKISGQGNMEKYTFEDDRATLEFIDRIEGIC